MSVDFPSFRYPYRHRITDLAMSNAFGVRGLQNCQSLLGGLRELSIGVITATRSVPRVTKTIRNLISFAPILEIITLCDVGLHRQNDCDKALFSDVFLHQHLRMLRKVYVYHYDTTERALVGFLDQHSSTIHTVHLSYMSITDTDWYSALTRSRDLKFPCLTSFVLHWCLGSEEEGYFTDAAVHPYVLRWTDEDPTIDADSEGD